MVSVVHFPPILRSGLRRVRLLMKFSFYRPSVLEVSVPFIYDMGNATRTLPAARETLVLAGSSWNFLLEWFLRSEEVCTVHAQTRRERKWTHLTPTGECLRTNGVFFVLFSLPPAITIPSHPSSTRPWLPDTNSIQNFCPTLLLTFWILNILRRSGNFN